MRCRGLVSIDGCHYSTANAPNFLRNSYHSRNVFERHEILQGLCEAVILKCIWSTNLERFLRLEPSTTYPFRDKISSTIHTQNYLCRYELDIKTGLLRKSSGVIFILITAQYFSNYEIFNGEQNSTILHLWVSGFNPFKNWQANSIERQVFRKKNCRKNAKQLDFFGITDI